MQLYLDGTAAVIADIQRHGDEVPFYPTFNDFLLRVLPDEYSVQPEGSLNGDLPDFRIYRCPRDAPIEIDSRICLIEAKPRDDNLDARIANDPTTQIARYLEHSDTILLTNYWDFRFLSLDEQGEILQVAHRLGNCQSAQEFEAFLQADQASVLAAHQDFQNFLNDHIETLDDWVDSSNDGIVRAMMSAYRACFDTLTSTDLDHNQINLRDVALNSVMDSIGNNNLQGNARFSSQLLSIGFLLGRYHNNQSIRQLVGQHIREPRLRHAYNTLVTESEVLGFQDYIDRLDFALCGSNSVFDSDLIEDLFLRFMEMGEDEFDSRELGLRPTPRRLVRFMINRADEMFTNPNDWRRRGIRAGHRTRTGERAVILDPCVGTGRFYIEVLRHIRDGWFQETEDLAVANTRMVDAIGRPGAPGRVIGLDISASCVLMTRFMLETFLLREGIEDEVDPRIHMDDSLVGWPGDVDEDGQLLLAHHNFVTQQLKTSRIDVIIGNPPWAGAESPDAGYQDGNAVVRHNSEWGLHYAEQMGVRNRGRATNISDPYVSFLRITHLKSLSQQDNPPVVCFVVPDSAHYKEKYVGFRHALIENYECVADLLGGQHRLTATGGKIFPVTSGSCVLTFRLSDDPSLRYQTLYAGNPEEKLAILAGQAEAIGQIPMTVSQAHLDTWLDFEDTDLEDYPWPNPLIISRYKTPGMEESRDRELVHACAGTLGNRLSMNTFHQDYDTAQQYRPRMWMNRSRFIALNCHTELTALGGYSEEYLRQITVTPMNHAYGYIDIRSRPNQCDPKSWNEIRRTAVNWGDTRGMICIPGQYQRAQNSNACLVPNLPGNKNIAFANCQSFPLQVIGEDGAVANLSTEFINWLFEDNPPDGDHIGLSHDVWYHVLAISTTPAYTETVDGAINKINEPGRASLYGQESRIPFPHYDTEIDGIPLFQEVARYGRFIAELHQPGIPCTDQELEDFRLLVRDWLNLGAISAGEPIQGGYYIQGWATNNVRKVTPRQPNMNVHPLDDLLAQQGQPLNNLLAYLGYNGDELCNMLGPDYVNLELNQTVTVPGVPCAVLNYSVGGQPVLSNWLSWRNEAQLGRQFNIDDWGTLSNLIVNISTLILMGPRLDELYQQVLDNIHVYGYEH